MFTGIVQVIATIGAVEREGQLLRFALDIPHTISKGLKKGASVSIDGVCQTVVSIEKNLVWFEAIEETLKLTTLGLLKKGCWVNIERCLKIGDEMGGHFLTGHIFCQATISQIEKNIDTFTCPLEWIKYIFFKGSIAIDGVSLTLARVDSQKGEFTIHFIPHTLKHTTLGEKKVGDLVNVELDPLVYAAVNTVEKTVLAFH